mgnify:CR=1 FL=1
MEANKKELEELKQLLEKNSIDISDMDDVISVAWCSQCCSLKNGK